MVVRPEEDTVEGEDDEDPVQNEGKESSGFFFIHTMLQVEPGDPSFYYSPIFNNFFLFFSYDSRSMFIGFKSWSSIVSDFKHLAMLNR